MFNEFLGVKTTVDAAYPMIWFRSSMGIIPYNIFCHCFDLSEMSKICSSLVKEA